MPNFIVNTGKADKVWSEEKLEKKLDGLFKAEKKSTWIHRNLKTVKSGFFGRIFWGFAKHFDWMRRRFYDIDLERSKTVLQQLQPQVAKGSNAHLKELFNQAVANFNSIAPHHWVVLGETPVSNQNSGKSTALPYYGVISAMAANAKLQGNPPGTYLIRSSEIQPYVHIICCINTQKAFQEYRLTPSEKGSGYTCNGKEYDTVENFIEKNKDSLKNPLPTEKPLPLPPYKTTQDDSANPTDSSTTTTPPTVASKPPKIQKPAAPLKRFAEMQAVQKSLQEGAKIEDLLIEAVKTENPEIASWLMGQGAKLDTLNQLKNLSAGQQKLCDWLGKITNIPEIVPANVDKLAIGLGYGYKAANLMIMQAKANKINEKLNAANSTSTVKVPPFLPIGDFQMQQYLMRALPNLQKQWEEFLDSFDPTLKEKFLKPDADPSKVPVKIPPIKISPKGMEIIANINKQVTEHFINNPYYTLQIEEWLKKEKPEFIIVRSTGKEDSDTNSNAGGNASIPFIKPDAHDISEAIGQVLASYFGKKSIEQRLLAGDKSLFNEKTPFLPVLLQVMVGENVGGTGSKHEDIPRSGVLFTRQQDKAKGVTFIQTGLGNNEGVVTSRVAVDSFYVGADKQIHATIRKKTTRFVSIEDDGKYKAEPIKNKNLTLENSQALPDNVILALKDVADDIAESYAAEKGGAKPMDMEYTVKLKDKSTNNPVIYLLQARPLQNTQGKKAVEHSFLDLKCLKAVPKSGRIQAQTLLDGNAYVREVNDPEEILFVDDLPKALDGYVNSDDPEKIKVIITKKTAPATSHEAVTLRPKGVAVMVVEDPKQFEYLKQLVEKADDENPVLFDPQRGMIVDTHHVKNKNELIKKGLISYPIPLEASIPRKGFMAAEPKHSPLKKADTGTDKLIATMHYYSLEQTYKDLINQLCDGKNFLQLESKAHPEGYNLRSLIDEMAMADAPQAKLALATILKLMHKYLIKQLHVSEGMPPEINQPIFQVFDAMVKMAKKELLPALNQHPAQSLERLYPIKFFDALIFQWPSNNVVRQYSYVQAMNKNASDKKAQAKAKSDGINLGGPLAFKHLQLMKLGNAAYSKECEKNWNTFLQEIVHVSKKNPKYLNETMKLVLSIMSMKIAPIWLNVIFNKEWMAKSGEYDQALKVLGELSKIQMQNQNTLHWVNEKSLELDIAESQIEQWGHPDFVKKNISKLRDLFINKLGFDPKAGPDSIKAKYDKSGQLGKLALMQFMHRAYDIYDQTIKAVKGSTEYPEDIEKVKDFAEILKCYFEMMEASLKLISPEDEKNIMKPVCGSTISFQEYVTRFHIGRTYHFGIHMKEEIKAIGFDHLSANINKDNFKVQMEARPEFSVDMLVVGSKVDFNYATHWPTRLEEYFTAFHQNMEKVVKHLNTKNGLNTSLFTGMPNVVSNEISSKFKQELTYIHSDGQNIEVAYTIPMRQHSSDVKVIFNPKAPEKGVDLFVHLFGPDEHDRWEHAATVAALLAHMGNTPFTGGFPPKINYMLPVQMKDGVSFSLHLPDGFKDHKKLLEKLYWCMMVMSMKYHNIVPAKFKPELEANIGPINWAALNEGFFADSFYVNIPLMDDFSKAGNTEMVCKIAKNSLLGLARQNFKDYTNKQVSDNLKEYIGNPDYKYVPGNQGTTPPSSLRTTATLHLIKALHDNPKKAAPVIQALIENPDIKKKMPDIVEALQVALSSLKPLEIYFEELWAKQDYAAFIIMAEKHGDSLMNNKADCFVKDQVSKGDKTILHQIAQKLYQKGYSHLAENTILSKVKGLFNEDDFKIYDMLKKAKVREGYLDTLLQNVNLLHNKALQYDAEYKEILRLSKITLIGLSQNEGFAQSYPAFPGLENYLGNKKFNYVFSNTSPTTTKLMKAAPLYIIKAFDSKNHEVILEGIDALKMLADDYLAFGKSTKQAPQYLDALVAISRGLYESTANKQEASKLLAKIWLNNQDVLSKLKDQHGIKVEA